MQQRIDAQVPGNCCTLIYTSGTTGPPKAVMISHDNVTWVSSLVVRNIIELGPDDVEISYLPLSHIAAQILDIHGPMVVSNIFLFSFLFFLNSCLINSILIREEAKSTLHNQML